METYAQIITARASEKTKKIIQHNNALVDRLRRQDSELELEILSDRDQEIATQDFDDTFESEYTMNHNVVNRLTRFLH